MSRSIQSPVQCVPTFSEAAVHADSPSLHTDDANLKVANQHFQLKVVALEKELLAVKPKGKRSISNITTDGGNLRRPSILRCHSLPFGIHLMYSKRE